MSHNQPEHYWECLDEFQAYIDSLSISEAEAALEGLREYQESVQKEREIELGWHRSISEDI